MWTRFALLAALSLGFATAPLVASADPAKKTTKSDAKTTKKATKGTAKGKAAKKTHKKGVRKAKRRVVHNMTGAKKALRETNRSLAQARAAVKGNANGAGAEELRQAVVNQKAARAALYSRAPGS